MLRQSALVILFLGVVAITGGCAQQTPPATGTADAEAKMKADALAWFDYHAKADADGMANLYAEDAVLMPPGTPAVTGRQAIKAFLGEDATKMKTAGLAIKNGTVTGAGVNGDIGWLSGNYTVVDASGATVDSGNYLSVHRRTNGVWLYIRDTWNSDRPPAPATTDKK